MNSYNIIRSDENTCMVWIVGPGEGLFNPNFHPKTGFRTLFHSLHLLIGNQIVKLMDDSLPLLKSFGSSIIWTFSISVGVEPRWQAAKPFFIVLIPNARSSIGYKE